MPNFERGERGAAPPFILSTTSASSFSESSESSEQKEGKSVEGQGGYTPAEVSTQARKQEQEQERFQSFAVSFLHASGPTDRQANRQTDVLRRYGTIMCSAVSPDHCYLSPVSSHSR
mmetsp:Transcript_17166/g.34805  ORF Transcript_17166/g.34805 Transcript_17166/m.34805 type:complete len:117 (+) Transcript_17166:1402-1752(+)